jgi:acyl carrier protein
MPRPITTIAAEIFQVDPGSLSSDSTPDQIDKWDSLAHLRLITAVEAEYSIRLSMQQIQELGRLGDLEAIVTTSPTMG